MKTPHCKFGIFQISFKFDTVYLNFTSHILYMVNERIMYTFYRYLMGPNFALQINEETV